MTSMWNAPFSRRYAGSQRKNDQQVKFFTIKSLVWIFKNKAYSPWYLVRYYRFIKFRILNPHIICRGMVFLGKNVEIHSTPFHSQMIIGRWVHIGDGNALRCHEGVLQIGDKVVMGKSNTINCYLDIEVGQATIIADWCYICDFDHRMDDINIPIKDQGIIKGPVRICEDIWVATKVTILKDTIIGKGSVLGAHAVVKGIIPEYSIAVGSPAKVVKNRKEVWEKEEQARMELQKNLADIERKKNLN